MPTNYQNQVNDLTGAMGPTNPALWNNTYKLTGPAYELSSQPMYFSPEKGYYVTSADLPASIGSASFSFGKRHKKKCRPCKKSHRKKARRVTRRKSRKVRRGSRGSRK
jgi:hypothetical protein